MTDPSQFYTGMIADLYEPLAGGLPDVAPYQRFVERFGGPTLELGCGSGLPMLDLIELGYEVEGLDASEDMLTKCKQKAAQRNLSEPILHHGLFQSFNINKKFASIYVASASFTLLTNDKDAVAALQTIRNHLLPGGGVWIPLEIQDPNQLKAGLNRFKSAVDDQGRTIKVGMTKFDVSDDERDITITLQYEREQTGSPEVSVRNWQRRFWNDEQFSELLEQAGWQDVTFLPKDPSLRKGAFVALLTSA